MFEKAGEMGRKKPKFIFLERQGDVYWWASEGPQLTLISAEVTAFWTNRVDWATQYLEILTEGDENGTAVGDIEDSVREFLKAIEIWRADGD